MKTYFIILLLFTISYCDDDGYSAKAFYNAHIKANIIEDIACAGLKSVAIQMCIDETQDNRCEEAINQYITCREQSNPSSSSSTSSSQKPRPHTPQEIKEEKNRKFNFWKQKLSKEYYPKLIEKYGVDEANKMFYKILTLIQKQIK